VYFLLIGLCQPQYLQESNIPMKPSRMENIPEELNHSKIEFIGEGYFGTVYRADIKRSSPKKEEFSVAIKVMKEIKNNEFAIHEFMLLSLCTHKNILSPYTLIGRRILVTEYLKCGTIENYLKDYGPLTMDKEKLFWKWGCDIADGMNYLHRHQILHLDLHVGNILMRDTFTVVIGDFGQARGRMTGVDIPKWYNSQMLKWQFIRDIVKTEKISSKTDVLFFGWLLSTLLQPNYNPSWNPPTIDISPKIQLIKECLNQESLVRPSFAAILETAQKQSLI